MFNVYIDHIKDGGVNILNIPDVSDQTSQVTIRLRTVRRAAKSSLLHLQVGLCTV